MVWILWLLRDGFLWIKSGLGWGIDIYRRHASQLSSRLSSICRRSYTLTGAVLACRLKQDSQNRTKPQMTTSPTLIRSFTFEEVLGMFKCMGVLIDPNTLESTPLFSLHSGCYLRPTHACRVLVLYVRFARASSCAHVGVDYNRNGDLQRSPQHPLFLMQCMTASLGGMIVSEQGSVMAYMWSGLIYSSHAEFIYDTRSSHSVTLISVSHSNSSRHSLTPSPTTSCYQLCSGGVAIRFKSCAQHFFKDLYATLLCYECKRRRLVEVERSFCFVQNRGIFSQRDLVTALVLPPTNLPLLPTVVTVLDYRRKFEGSRLFQSSPKFQQPLFWLNSPFLYGFASSL
ncbi:hypothetical protein VNO77_44337 [Canavalia gladiata]|uniref:Uncharacterized protein n=1 Tax=Canavalia gladiata TaxID=3824 RepID=A0AAN9JWW4_CANGL